VDTATFKIGGTEIELIEGKSDDSPIRKYIEKRGPGIHHIAFSVANIEDAIAKLNASSVKFINDEPTTGKGNSRIVFIHPSSTQGILYELVEPGEIKKD
jgi:methylmalonyl-CoA/ethylmalonyl-CoA epimerase